MITFNVRFLYTVPNCHLSAHITLYYKVTVTGTTAYFVAVHNSCHIQVQPVIQDVHFFETFKWFK